MKSHRRRSPLVRRSFATGALVLGLAAGHGAFAQPAGKASPALLTASASAQDIRDIRGPKPIPSEWFIPLVVITVLLSSASIYATWTWYRRRQRTYLRTPFEIAMDRLENARALMRPELGREFSTEVSGIAREYIERRFQVMAAHLTTHEFLFDLLDSSDPVLAAHRELLADFLEACDLAKFGGWNLSISAMETMLQGARRFVVESTVEPDRSDTVRAAAPPPSHATVTRPVAPREPYDSVPTT